LEKGRLLWFGSFIDGRVVGRLVVDWAAEMFFAILGCGFLREVLRAIADPHALDLHFAVTWLSFRY
jgi:hypothetical protein